MFIVFLIGVIGFALYLIIKTTVKNGVKEAIEKQSGHDKKRLLIAITK
jgi:hypothetical protein